MDFHGNINLRDNEIQNLVFEQETSFPVDATLGSIVFKDNALYMAVALNVADPIWIPLTASIDTYVHEQEATATTWTITHNLGEENLILQVYNDANEMVIPDTVTPTDTNEIVVTFNTAIAGRVIVMFGDEIPANGIGIIDPVVGWVGQVDILNLTYDSVSYDASPTASLIRSMSINSDGTKLYILENSSGIILQYTIGTAWDISTASYDSVTYDISSEQNAPAGLFITDDGTKMFALGSVPNVLGRYTLSIPWDISSASYDSNSMAVAGNTRDLYINNTGLKLFLIGQVDHIIKEYSLSVAYDLTTATLDATFDVGNFQAYGIMFNPDGTQLFVTGDSNKVYQVNLSTGFDLTTASNIANIDVSSEISFGSGLHFKDDGSKLYVSSLFNTDIHQYSTNI